MINSHRLTHHQRTLQLWEAMGQELVVSATEGTQQRKRLRFLVPDAPCQLDVIGAEHGRTIEVVVHDVVTGGVCLLSSRSLPTCQAVTLHPPADAQREVEAVNGRAISCRKRPNHYRIGTKLSEGE